MMMMMMMEGKEAYTPSSSEAPSWQVKHPLRTHAHVTSPCWDNRAGPFRKRLLYRNDGPWERMNDGITRPATKLYALPGGRAWTEERKFDFQRIPCARVYPVRAINHGRLNWPLRRIWAEGLPSTQMKYLSISLCRFRTWWVFCYPTVKCCAKGQTNGLSVGTRIS